MLQTSLAPFPHACGCPNPVYAVMVRISPHLRSASFIQQDIGRLEVAMYGESVVKEIHTGTDIPHDASCPLLVKRLLGFPSEPVQIPARQEFHDHNQSIALGGDSPVELHGVGTVEASHGFQLTHEGLALVLLLAPLAAARFTFRVDCVAAHSKCTKGVVGNRRRPQQQQSDDNKNGSRDSFAVTNVELGGTFPGSWTPGKLVFRVIGRSRCSN